MSRKKSSRKGFAMGALMGGLFGGLTALLFAPKTGKKLRKDLAETYHKVADTTDELMDDVREHGTNLYHDVQSQASKLMKRKRK